MNAARPEPAPAPLGRTSDFTTVAARYDETRDLPAAILDDCYRRLAAQGILPPGAVVVDVGCGTGQISLPLAAAGYDVWGYDIAPAMVAIARSKCRPGWLATFDAADARILPLADGTTDAVVVSKLLAHVSEWRAVCDEMVRVLRPGGAVIHIADRGSFGNPVRRFVAGRANALGFTGRFPGASDADTVARYHATQGCTPVPVDVADLRWTRRVCYGDVLEQFAARLFAEFWYLPPDIYGHILAEAGDWVDGLPEGRGTTVEMTPWLEVRVQRTPGG